MNEVKLNNGQKVKLSGQSVEEYCAWRKALLEQRGKELSSNFPKYYGKISFNIQGGKCVGWNMSFGDIVVNKT